MPLIRYNGKLLAIDGALATSLACCCEDPPPPPDCPPCCVKIEWGEFNEDGNLIGQYTVSGTVIDVKIIMPTPSDRLVCDGQSVQVNWEMSGTLAVGSNGAWARWGAAWRHVSHSPSIASDGLVNDRGLVDWGDLASEGYSVSLEFHACFLDSSNFFGHISIGMDDPDFNQEIDISRCVTTEYCCDEEVECEDCCAMLSQGEAIRYDGKYYLVAEQGGWTMIVSFELSSEGKICVGEGIMINIKIIPPRSSGRENNLVINHDGWEHDSHTPDIGVDGEITNSKTDWGTLEALEYTISLSNRCSCDRELQFPDITITSNLAGAVGIGFDDCDLTECCPSICSYVTGLYNTGQETSGPEEDGNDDTCNVDAHWTVGGGPAFIIGRVAPMAYGCFGSWISTACDTFAEPGGIDGFESTFKLEFNIAEGACLEKIVLVGEFSADNYVAAGGWKVNGVDQGHIPHGSFTNTETIGCIEYEINYSQGNWIVGLNTIEITVKNGWVGSGMNGYQFGLNLTVGCIELVEEEP